MIASQFPTLQVFVPVEPMARADVPSQRLPPVAAIQADDVVLMNGSPYRYSRCENFLGRNGLSKLTERRMHGSDEIGKLLRSHLMLDDVTLDDYRC
jgi:hypothetical protein